MSSQKLEFTAVGMHCAACENYLETRMKKLQGVKKVEAKLASKKVFVEIESTSTKEELAKEFTNLVSENGYTIETTSVQKNWTKELKELGIAGIIAFILVIIYLSLESFGLIPKAGSGFSLNPMTSFALGIVASLSTCSAVLGGIILSLSANTSKVSKKLAFASGISFHIARVLAFLILGGVLGYLGLIISQSGTFDSLEFSFWTNIVLAIVMLVLGINLLNLFDFSKLNLRMPKIFGTNITSQSEKSIGIWGGTGLGVLSFFLPCNFTQAMQFSAFTSGSIIDGAILLFAFALGTLPVLAILTFASINFAKSFRSGIFYKTSGLLILVLAVYTLFSSLYLKGIMFW